jgi:hypothetical protein
MISPLLKVLEVDGYTNTTPTAAQTTRFAAMSATMIAIAGKGSLLMYGTRAWYSEALFEIMPRVDDLGVSSSWLRVDKSVGGDADIVRGSLTVTNGGYWETAKNLKRGEYNPWL